MSTYSSSLIKTWQKTFRRLSFLMAFPGIVIVFNISLYFFLFLVATSSRLHKGIKKRVPLIFKITLSFFLVSAFFSVFGVPTGIGSPSFLRSLSVLPNFIYWVLLCFFLIQYREVVDYLVFEKAIFYGVIVYVPFWFIRENFLQGMPIVQKTSQNNLAFLMICYSPIALGYAKKAYSRLFFAFISTGVLLLMLYLERRAGFVLVGASVFAIYFIKKLSLKGLFPVFLFAGFLFILGQTNIVRSALDSVSPEIHDLMYELEDVRVSDRSYLTRVAMWEKAKIIIEENPLTGVGLVNFHHSDVVLRGDFEGAQYVINKRDFNRLSAHNSYASALGEGGILLFSALVLLIIVNSIGFIGVLDRLHPQLYPLFYGFIGMIFHFTAIVGYLNVYSWFITAMVMVTLTKVWDAKNQY